MDAPRSPCPALVAAKLALHPGKLGITEDAVRRLLDLDHAARIEQLEQALALLGKKPVVDIMAA